MSKVVLADTISGYNLQVINNNFDTIEDALKKRGEASGWTSTDSDACRPYAVDIEILYTPPCGGIYKEKIVLEDFRYEQLQHDIKNAQVSCSGKCNVTEATVTREAP